MQIIGSPAFSNKKSNPYNYLLYGEVEKQSIGVNESLSVQSLLSSKIWHVHWPESFLGSKTFLGCISRFFSLLSKSIIVKIFGLKIVWTVHNIQPHEARYPFLNSFFYKYFPLICDGFIFLSKESLESAGWISSLPKKKKVIFHGHYKGILTNIVEQENAKKKLGLSSYSTVYLFFGIIRKYKGVPRLISEFTKLGVSASCLCIVGSSSLDDDLSREVARLVGKHENVIFQDKFVSELELQLWVSAADLVVLPYEKITNSGSVLYALSANRHVVAPRLGGMTEIKENVGEWLSLYEGAFKGEMLLEASAVLSSKSVNLESYEWPLIAKQTIDFYNDVLGFGG